MRRATKIIVLSTGMLLTAVAIFFIVIFFQKRPSVQELDTLTKINNYAKALPEFPNSDDNDWLDPHYDTFYRTRAPTALEKLLRTFDNGHKKQWTPFLLSQLVKALTAKNRKFGLDDGRNTFIHIKAAEPASIFVFGDLHGAFHSLLRDLEYLKRHGIIDDRLIVADSNKYLIFNGDVINRSAYNIDSLILVAMLMTKNPHNVFYIAGKHERDSHWLDFGLKRELIARGKEYSKQTVPFQRQLDDFFRSLPEAVYITGSDDNHQAIRIAFNEQKQLYFDESQLSTSFISKTPRVKAYEFIKRQAHEPKLDVITAIKTEEWRKSNRISHGLGLLDQDQGATTWAVLSSPITVHRLYLDFHDDAFIEINIKNTLPESTLTRIYRDSRKDEDFISDTRNMITAGDIVKGSADSIKIASTMSLVRGVPTMGQQARLGLNLRVNNHNRTHIDGHSNIRIYVDNDDYIPKIARSNVREYINDGIKFLLLPTGTPTTMAYIDLVHNEDFAVFFPITGASSLRNPRFKKLIHFRASYEDEVRALIATLVEEYGARKFAFFYQDDSYGRGPFHTAVNELSRRGINNYLALPYTRGTVSFDLQNKELAKNQPDALGFFATATATQELIRQTGITSIASTQLFAISFVGELTLRRFAKRHGLNILFGSCVPNPKLSKLPIAELYRQEMDEIKRDYDVFSFEAYLATSILLHAIDSLKDQKITPTAVMTAMENMKNTNFQGLTLNFNKKTRSLAKTVWLESDNNTSWKEFSIDGF